MTDACRSDPLAHIADVFHAKGLALLSKIFDEILPCRGVGTIACLMVAKKTQLCSLILLLRDTARGVRFYRDGLGLSVRSESKNFARIAVSDNVTLDLREARS